MDFDSDSASRAPRAPLRRFSKLQRAVVEALESRCLISGVTKALGVTAVLPSEVANLADDQPTVNGPVPSAFNGPVNDVLLQPDHKIVIGGTYHGNFELARYRGSGGLDSSFSSDGILSTD